MTPDHRQETATFCDSLPGDSQDIGAFVAAHLGHVAVSNRIDPPHEAQCPVIPPLLAEPEPTGRPVLDGDASERLRFQADQLAAYLCERQRELDHRESELNSRIARLETETRAARLWFSQRESDLEFEAEELARFRRDADAEFSASRHRELDETAKRLAEGKAELETLRNQQSQRWQTAQDEAAALREQLAADHRKAMADLSRKRQAIERRADRLDHSSKALKQLRAELLRIHRETLETRLATEETLAQVSGAAPPAVLTQAIARSRDQLAERYRQAESELVEQGKELATIRKQLAKQHGVLAERKKRIERWAAGRQEDLQKQTSRLVARERQLRQTELLHGEERQHWREERIKYEQELRRLRAELDRRGEG